MSFEFYVTSAPPAPAAPFGGNRSTRTRTNPFDAPIKQSHEQKLSERGEWLEFKVDPAEVAKHVNRIRSSGQYLKLGTEVRVDKENGRIAFRGVDYRPRAHRAAKASDAAQPAAADVTAQPTGQNQPWTWEAPLEAQPQPASN